MLDEAGAAVDLLVVFRDAVVDTGIVQAGVHRNHVVRDERIAQVVLQIFSEGNPGFDLDDLVVETPALVQILVGGISDVHRSLLALIAGEVGFHVTQFSLDNHEALIDERGGIDGALVLFADGVLVVLFDQRVQDVRGTLGVVVLDEQVQDGAASLRDTESGNVAIGGAQDGNLVDRDFFAEIIRAVGGRRFEDQLVAIDGNGVTQRHIAGFRTFYQLDGAVVHRNHLGRERQETLVVPVEEQAHRRPAVEFHVAEALPEGVVHIGIQGLDHFGHQGLGPQLQDFIGHIDAVDQLAVGGQAGSAGRAARVLDDDPDVASVHERRLRVFVVGVPDGDAGA